MGYIAKRMPNFFVIVNGDKKAGLDWAECKIFGSCRTIIRSNQIEVSIWWWCDDLGSHLNLYVHTATWSCYFFMHEARLSLIALHTDVTS